MINKRQVVLTKNPNIKSPAAAFLLCKKYRKLELWMCLKFRMEFLNQFTDEELICQYCGNDNLVRETPENNRRQPHNLATIDHVIPVSKGGGKYDIKNCVVACYSCNQKKSDKII